MARAWRLAVICVALLAAAPAAEAAKAKGKAAPPEPAAAPPPPPPLTGAALALDTARRTFASATARLPSAAACKTAATHAGTAALGHAAAASRAIHTHLGALATASKALYARSSNYSAPAQALVSRILAATSRPCLPEAALVACFVLCCLGVRARTDLDNAKVVARGALVCAVLNWVSFAIFLNIASALVVIVLTALDGLLHHPSLALLVAMFVNRADVRRAMASCLPSKRAKRVSNGAPAASQPEMPKPEASPAPTAPVVRSGTPAAGTSTGATPDAAKVRPSTPASAAKPSPGVRLPTAK